jgi:hypothetical protein
MSSIASLNSDAKSELHRNVADFKPSVWGNYFDQYASESMVSKHIFCCCCSFFFLRRNRNVILSRREFSSVGRNAVLYVQRVEV